MGNRVAFATLACLAVAALACVTARPVTPKDEPVGTRAGAQARALIYARSTGLLLERDAKPIDRVPFGIASLAREATAATAEDAEVVARAAAALPATLCGPLTILFEDRLTDGALFHLSSLRLHLDQVPIADIDGIDAVDARRYLVFEGKVAAGEHRLRVGAVYRGDGAARAYTWTLVDRAVVSCGRGSTTPSVTVAGSVRSSNWLEAPSIIFEGALAAAPPSRVVDNDLVAVLIAFREAVRVGLLPQEEAAAIDALLATTPPLVDRRLSNDESGKIDRLRRLTPAGQCALRIQLDDALSDGERFTLAGASVALDGVTILDAPSIGRQDFGQQVQYLLFKGPVRPGQHRVSATARVLGPPTSGATAKQRESTLANDVTVDCAREGSVTISVTRCINRPLDSQPGLRLIANERFKDDDCEEY